jgi:hypothetical protein
MILAFRARPWLLFGQGLNKEGQQVIKTMGIGLVSCIALHATAVRFYSIGRIENYFESLLCCSILAI